MRKLFTTLAIIASVTLGGCLPFLQDAKNTFNIITGVNVSPQAVVIAVNGADGLQDTATAYLGLPICRPGGTPICRVKAATQPLKRAVLAMRSARNDLEDWYAAHPNTAAPASLYEKVTGAVQVLGDVINRYRAAPVIAAIAK